MSQIGMKECYSLLNKYKIPCSTPVFLESLDDVRRIKSYPVAMKVVSSDVVHKSDVGGVVLDIPNEQAARVAHMQITDAMARNVPSAKIEGIAAFPMHAGIQLFVGMKRDPSFGPVIAFGLGGIYVEVLKDISLHVGSPSPSDAMLMLSRIKSSAILNGARGQSEVNRKAIANIIVKVGLLAIKEPRIIELDLNPIIANEREAVVVDVRMVVE